MYQWGLQAGQAPCRVVEIDIVLTKILRLTPTKPLSCGPDINTFRVLDVAVLIRMYFSCGKIVADHAEAPGKEWQA